MEYKRLTNFIGLIFSEGNRLQKTSIKGTTLTTKRFTQTQVFSFCLSLTCLFLLPAGFGDNFAGYTISFLGIFIGLFTGIVVSLHDKSKSLLEGLSQIELTEKARRIKVKNYMLQFTGLTAYSIVLGLFVALLLSISLLTEVTQENIFRYSFVKNVSEIGVLQIINFIKVVLLAAHRFFTIYFLLNFFAITTYAISSYFYFLISDYKRMRISSGEDISVGIKD